MSARPCPTSLTGCPGVDSPITNVSAEAADPLLFAAEAWDLYDPYKPPRLGDGISIRRDCAAIVNAFSIYDPIIYAGSQALANLMALAQSLGCTWPNRPGVTYGNDEQTGTVYCSSGAAFTYTVPADTVTFTTDDVELGTAFVQWANAWAAAYAFEQASALLDCPSGDPDNPPPPGRDPPTFPSGPGILNNPSWLCFGEEYHDTYHISGARTVGYTLEIISGAIPPGTTFTQTGPREAVISGTPTAPGIYSWTIKGTSTSLPTTTVQFTDNLWVMGITNADLDDICVSTDQDITLSVIGGTPPYTFALDPDSDPMPTGLSLSGNGHITGSPTTDGDFTILVSATDVRGGECVQSVTIPVVTCTGWKICDWPQVRDSLPSPATPCPASAQVAWDGLFSLQTTYSPPNNWPLWYFVNRSVLGSACAASDCVSGAPATDYPTGDWQNNWAFTELQWTGGGWALVISCAELAPGGTTWTGFVGLGDSVNINDPSGVYTAFLGTPSAIAIKSAADTCCASNLAAPEIAYTTNAYQYNVVAAFGTGPYTYDAYDLPTGLAINHGTGVISGTPTVVGTYRSLIVITDSLSARDFCHLTFDVQACNLCCGGQTCLDAFTYTETDTIYFADGTITGHLSGAGGTINITQPNGFVTFGGAARRSRVVLCLETPRTLNASIHSFGSGTSLHEWSADVSVDTIPVANDGVPTDTPAAAYNQNVSGSRALAAGNHTLDVVVSLINDDPAGGPSNMTWDISLSW